jgi:CheY-like chemotaxis protein
VDTLTKFMEALGALAVAIGTALAAFWGYKKVTAPAKETKETTERVIRERYIVEEPDNEFKKPQIMLIEDEPQQAEMIRAWLNGEYDVSVFTHPCDALSELFQQVKRNACPDLIILDFKMKKMNGGQVAGIMEIAGENAGNCRPKIAILTGLGADVPRPNNVSSIWFKPGDLRRIKDLVADALK